MPWRPPVTAHRRSERYKLHARGTGAAIAAGVSFFSAGGPTWKRPPVLAALVRLA
jgi:hypothetical protein